MIRWLFLIVLCGFQLWFGCTLRQDAVGSNHEVVVVVSPATWSRFEDTVRSIFGRTILTPQEELIFTLRVVTPEDFDFYRKFRNVLVLSTLDAQDDGGALVNSLLSGEALTQVLRGQAYMFLKRDVWVRGQTLMVLTGSDEMALAHQLREKGDEIFEVQENALNEKVKAWLYEKAEQKKLEEKLFRKYGWSVRIPCDYLLEQERSEDHFIFLRKTIPERWLFVYWEEAEHPEVVTEQWCLAKRTEIGTTFYQGDTIVEEFTGVEKTVFLEWEALRITGLWKNQTAQADFAAGGPFRSYCFYDPATKRVYMVDIAIFAPGMSKEPYLRQLDIIAHTFHT